MATAAVMPFRNVEVSLSDVLKSLNPFSSGSLWSTGNDATTPSGPSLPGFARAMGDAWGITGPSLFATDAEKAQLRAEDNSQLQNGFFSLPGIGDIANPIDARQADAIATESTFGSAPGLTPAQNAANRDYVRNYITQQNAAMSKDNIFNNFADLFSRSVYGGADPNKSSFPWVLVILAVVAIVVMEAAK